MNTNLETKFAMFPKEGTPASIDFAKWTLYIYIYAYIGIYIPHHHTRIIDFMTGASITIVHTLWNFMCTPSKKAKNHPHPLKMKINNITHPRNPNKSKFLKTQWVIFVPYGIGSWNKINTVVYTFMYY